MSRAARLLLRISPDEASFERRGFRAASVTARRRLEAVGRTFLFGYNTALESPGPDELAGRLETVEAERRGFAYEGASMALALLDRLAPWNGGRFARWVAGPADSHAYMAHVGAGWVLARIPLGRARALGRMDPLLRWLAVDGVGFHEGYFHPERTVVHCQVPRRLEGYARRAFDQGLGRALWFVHGADAQAIAATLERFPAGRRADLWSGVGLACTYAGGADPGAFDVLRRAGARFRAELAQGAAFAAGARARAGNPAPHTDAACRAFCGASADEAAAATTETLHDLHPAPDAPAYEVWRLRLRLRFLRTPAAV
ncbi:MAG TPA: DUF1702 family protein [Longimicrobium sp.]|jgi:hypothetical protein